MSECKSLDSHTDNSDGSDNIIYFCLEYYPEIDRVYYAIRKDVLVQSEYFKALCEDVSFGKDPKNPFIFEVSKMQSTIHFSKNFFPEVVKCLSDGCTLDIKDSSIHKTLSFFGIKYNQNYLDEFKYNVEDERLYSDQNDKIRNNLRKTITQRSISDEDIMHYANKEKKKLIPSMKDYLDRIAYSPLSYIEITRTLRGYRNNFVFYSDQIGTFQTDEELYSTIAILFYDEIVKTAKKFGYSLHIRTKNCNADHTFNYLLILRR
jgi:hypothetical protein